MKVKTCLKTKMNKCLRPAVSKPPLGFSVIELLVVVGIIFVFAAVTVPTLMTQIYSIRLRYSAVNLSEVLQSARMEAVRRNTFYSVQYVAGSTSSGTPAMEQVVDKTSAVVSSIPPTVLGSSVSVFFGTGSGAPGETSLVTSLNFTPAASTAGLPSFNARGLPCIPVAGTTCPATVGQGFIFFLSGMSVAAQAPAWTAVAVTPSGRCQIFAYDSGTWTQQ